MKFILTNKPETVKLKPKRELAFKKTQDVWSWDDESPYDQTWDQWVDARGLDLIGSD